jgi:TRAP-type C4-dicarboxylate transport system permease small subunit
MMNLSLVTRRQRKLKWTFLDPLEQVMMVLCGVTLFCFSTTTVLDIVTRLLGNPWLWLQEATSTFSIYGIFLGTAVATRRNDHLYLTATAENLTGTKRTIVEILSRVVIACVALCMIVFGYENFLRGFSSFRMPSLTPIASLYVVIPISGALILLFAIEQIINGFKHGFEHEDTEEDAHIAAAMAVAEAFGGYTESDKKS